MANTKTFGVALFERPLDEGLTQQESNELFEKLHGTTAIPIEIEAEYSAAMGWINLTDAEIMSYDYTGLTDFVQEILEDMQKESPTGEYVYNDANSNCEIEILLIR